MVSKLILDSNVSNIGVFLVCKECLSIWLHNLKKRDEDVLKN